MKLDGISNQIIDPEQISKKAIAVFHLLGCVSVLTMMNGGPLIN